MTKDNHCIDCGNPTSGLRCKPCNGRLIAREWAERRNVSDASLLAEVAAGLTAQRLAVRLDRSRQWATVCIKKAQRRQALLADVR